MKLWKCKWLEVKGQPWLKQDCIVITKICYNCLVESFTNDSLSVQCIPVAWYNAQVVFCCKEILNVFFDNCEVHNALHQYVHSCEEVTSIIGKTIAELEKMKVASEQLKKFIQYEVLRISYCLCVIWLTYPENLHSIRALTGHVFTGGTFATDNSDSAVLLKMICSLLDSSFDYTTITTWQKNINKNYQASRFYMLAYFLYSRRQHEKVLMLCSEFEKEKSCSGSLIMPLLHNLRACCHMCLEKPQSAIMYWRKAITIDDYTHFLPILFNLQQAYATSDMVEAEREILLTLSSASNIMPVESTGDDIMRKTALMFELENNSSKTYAMRLTLNEHPSKSDEYKIKYLVGSHCLKYKDYIGAISLYNILLKHQTAKYDPTVPILDARNYQLPIIIPNISQIHAELSHAHFQTSNFDEVMDINCELLQHCAKSFRNKQTEILYSEVENQVVPIATIRSYNETASQFYFFLCIMLYKISVLIGRDCSKAKTEISMCLQIMDTVLPDTRKTEVGSTEDYEDSTVKKFYYEVTKKLGLSKAKLYFNLALVLSILPDYKESDVLRSIQGAIQYDSGNIVMRWNVVMLLWKIGQTHESMKTWCKTRSINYRKSASELQQLRNKKLTMMAECTSSAQKDLLQKDISILRELLVTIL